MAGADDEELSRNVAWEIARLKTFDPPIRADSVAYEVDAKGWAYIWFEIETDVLLEPEDTPILDVEPIRLRYSSENSVGRRAPSVFSAREDFPRDLPHINPSADNEPAWLCLARSGLQRIYDADGIAGVVEQLVRWLNDAKTENLYADGWDPVPGLDFEECVVGRIDAAALQEYAKEYPRGGGAYLNVTLSHRADGRHFVGADEAPIDLADNDTTERAKAWMAFDREGDNQRERGQILRALRRAGVSGAVGNKILSTYDAMPVLPFDAAIPGIFVWPSNESVETVPHFNRWRDMASLRDGLERTKLDVRVDEFFQLIDIYFRQSPDGISPELDHFGTPAKKAILLIVGLWRPVPIDETIVGLSGDSEARKLELRVFYLERPAAEDDRWSQSTIIRDFYGLIPVSSELYESVSGQSALPHVGLIGAGALGSAVADHALRGGATRLTVIDNDRLLPHNLARHLGTAMEIPDGKTGIVKRQAQALGGHCGVSMYSDDITDLSDCELCDRVNGTEIIIDATAEPLVRARLSRWRERGIPILRSEIFHKGRLGVHLITRSASEQSLNCLYYQTILYALGNRWLRDWLAYEATRTFRDEELLVGFGCASKTTRLPKHMLDAHASTASALAHDVLNFDWASRIVLNRLNEHGLPEGTDILEPDIVDKFEDPADLNGWKIIVTRGVIERMRAQKNEKAPNETGGYLYGGIDEMASEIYIVAASPEPPGTKASPTSLELGPCGRTQFEKGMIRKTCGRLAPLGSWHSHPSGELAASAKDWATVAKFKKSDKRYGQPTMIAITGATGERFYVAAD